jgi:hypothetical protein
MFEKLRGIFSKTPGPTAPVEKPLSEKEQRAYELGRDTGARISEDYERYISWRYEQIRQGYLDVLQKQIDSGRQQDEYPPMTVARVEYSLFLDHVKEAQEQLKAETKAHFEEWENLNKELEVEDLTDKLVESLLSDRFTALRLEGLKVLTDNVDILKTADDNWRRKYPEKSKEYPVDE